MALRCGVSVSEYNDMTPRELMLIVEEYNHRQQSERNNLITNAYLSAIWQRAKKMPRLSEVLSKSTPKKPTQPQTPEQMLQIAKMLHYSMTGEG